jgi:hypothetical protein
MSSDEIKKKVEVILEEFPDAVTVTAKDNSWALSCSKCTSTHWMSTEHFSDEIEVLMDSCIRGTDSFNKTMKKFGLQEVPKCDGKTNYILIK